MVETRDRVLQLLREGKSAAEIARELAISKPAVSKHVAKLVDAGLWSKLANGQSQAPSPPAPPPKQNSKPRGGPPGNKKAVGNRGNRNASAPLGNKNAVKTGEYETIFADTLDDDELEIYLGIDTDAVRQAEEEVRLLTIRERRMMQRIANLKQLADRDGMTVVEITEEESDKPQGRVDATTRKRQGVLGQIQAIEEALTRVQERKRAAIELLHKLRGGGNPDNADKLDQLLERMEAAARAAIQPKTS